MANVHYANTSGFGGSSFKAPRFDFTGIFSRIASYYERVQAERQLAALDDRMLADIGIERADIGHVVRGLANPR
ncbi:MAG: DUF1127 domain-containing protein [Hyphomicrobiales bacterium]